VDEFEDMTLLFTDIIGLKQYQKTTAESKEIVFLL